jgi:hypothetical protein
VQEAWTGLNAFFERYNHRRLHQSQGLARQPGCIWGSKFGGAWYLYALFRYAQQSIQVPRKSDILLTGSIFILAVFGLDNGEYHKGVISPLDR